MKIALFISSLAGAALLTALFVSQGIGPVLGVLARVRWGFLAVSAYHLVPLLVFTLSWRVLLTSARPSIPSLLSMRWVSESINSLLPVGQVGGDLVRARLAVREGTPRLEAISSVLVDFSLGLLSQVPFAVLGTIVLVARGGGGGQARTLVIGLSAFGALLAVAMILQFTGIFRRVAVLLARLRRGGGWDRLVRSGEAIDQALAGLYRRRGAIAFASLGRFAGWLLGTGEVWLALRFLGRSPGLAEAVLIESLSQAVRSAAFVIPGGLGMQEGAIMLLGNAVGLTAETSLALSLIKRARELVLGIPGLLAWQVMEGRHWLRKPAGAGRTPAA